ncbi:MAG: aldo/keto reductase, partial [Desulfofustis sp.]|nr:aldo/keto reductase [Desulfofustis sp.]
MKYRELGGSGIKASVVGFGAWAIGGWMWGGADEKEAIGALHAALDCGMNLVDTAPMYGFGRSEEIVGKAIRDRRSEVVLATKCGLIWHEQRGDFYFASDDKHPSKEGDQQIYRCLAPEVIRYEVEQSLRRLQTDYIDLYQTHWQETTTPIAETMETLLTLQREGKIRAIGCCNASREQLDAYRAAGRLDCDQELYSMLDRTREGTNLAYARRHGLALLAYSPLAQGLLSGLVGPERQFAPGDQRNLKPRFSVENRQRVRQLLDCFLPIADRHQINLSQVAIAWTVARPGCSHALVGARNAEQVRE